jgi:protein tyrosine/serine phosphatase
VAGYDLSTPAGRAKAYWNFWWGDHAFLRLGFTNAHWIGPDMVRTNQPWPFQLKWWRDQGIKTVVNLRGGFDASFYALERDACERLGLKMVDFTVTSRDVPRKDQVFGARDLFRSIEYPALMHCKSGADRAGIMSVFYRHFHLGEPISVAIQELSLRHLHVKQGLTGVLDYIFALYLEQGEAKGLTFAEWVDSPAYDPPRIKADFRAGRVGKLVTETLLKRE